MILDALSDAGYVLDTPGALLRGALAGKPGERASGEDLLGAYGLPGGALGGFAAELALDPMALGGLAAGAYGGVKGLLGATRAGNALSHADDANPLLRGIGHLVGGEEGYLRFPIHGVDPDLAAAMDGLGPQYPGGVEKLHGLAADALGSRPIPGISSDSGFRAYMAARAERPAVTPGIFEGEEQAWLDRLARTAHPTAQAIYSRFDRLAAGPHGEQLASEIPGGSKFLGAGAEGLAVRTPDGGVIRIGDRPIVAGDRVDIPEMLQPYRVAQAGPYKVEHLPFVHPVANAFDEGLERARRQIAGLTDPDLASGRSLDAMIARDANAGMNYQFEGITDDLRGEIGSRGYNPWDVSTWNTSLTPEGRAIVHDGGAILGPDPFVRPTHPVPGGDLLTRVLAAGGPEKVRESLRRGLAEGTRGQGVGSPYLEDVLRERSRVQDFLRSLGIDAGPDIGRA